jgi:hypothetical protein
MEDGLMDVGDAFLVEPEHLLVCAIDVFTAREPLDGRKIGDSIEADEMEHNKICLHEGTHGVDFQVPLS